LSPVFEAISQIERPALGTLKFTELVRRVNIPVYALGGISQDTIMRLHGSGATGIAGIGLFNSPG
ncbi:MAG: thiamine phosphate synthase, partial [Rhodospirillaceae bacterium]|nr:thiamine phosphate synthase [Rhodospirillaceae bacterium]